MDSTGWIKLYRKFIDWEWFSVSEMVHLFIYLLLSANKDDGEWKGVAVKRGQLITGRKSLSVSTGISEQTIRTCLQKLEKTKEITTTPTNKYTIITICKFEEYQPQQKATNQQPNQQLTNNQPTTNHKQEDKEVKNSLKDDQNLFKEEVESFTDKYDLKMLTAFWAYWSEPNKTKTRMRKDLEKTWDTERRLLTWYNRQKK